MCRTTATAAATATSNVSKQHKRQTLTHRLHLIYGFAWFALALDRHPIRCVNSAAQRTAPRHDDVILPLLHVRCALLLLRPAIALATHCQQPTIPARPAVAAFFAISVSLSLASIFNDNEFAYCCFSLHPSCAAARQPLFHLRCAGRNANRNDLDAVLLLFDV